MGENTKSNRRSDNYKFWFDRTFMLSAHLILLPFWIFLWIIIPLTIWLDDRGPIFYRQQRAGKNGRTFTILKFRTMVPDAELRGPSWTTKDDPRITRVGRLLRRTALDELPGILSVWKGDMSLVGPRALDLAEHQSSVRQIPGFEQRLQVRPGLTGLAQVYDKEDRTEIKLNFDLKYLEQMSLWLDCKLLVLSVKNTLTANWDRRSGKLTQMGSDAASFGGEGTTAVTPTAGLDRTEFPTSDSNDVINDGTPKA